jgi:hypothetical protein
MMAAFFHFQSYHSGFQMIEKDKIIINICFQISDLGGSQKPFYKVSEK